MENILEHNEKHNHAEYFKLDFLKDEISKAEDFSYIAGIFSLMSDTTRLKIFWLLCHSKECVLNIAKIMNMTMPAVSHHLKLLKAAELIESYRDGKEVFYTSSASDKSQILHVIIEKLMTITCPDFKSDHEKINVNSVYLENQVETIKKAHDYMTENLEKRISIEEIAKKFAMNTTTLKTVFKDVYGNSIAAHIKEHRMEKAAKMLIETGKTIYEVSQEVGYESQSKFSAAFKEFYNVTPVEYKKENYRRK